MSTCTFFGHRDCPSAIEPELRETIKNLIKNHGVNEFFVGNHGNFDSMVIKILRLLKKDYSYIKYSVVLAYMPGKRIGNESVDLAETVFPEGMETVPHRIAPFRLGAVQGFSVMPCFVTSFF